MVKFKLELSNRNYVFDLYSYFVLSAIVRNLQTGHDTGRFLCSPLTKRIRDTLRAALVHR